MTADDRTSWPPMPELHAEFLARALAVLPEVPGIAGVAAGGSFATGGMDDQSDLDLVLGVEPSHWPAMLERRKGIAASLGSLLEAFTGEHVGEPRLLICLYGPPLLHMDLKFMSLDDVHERVEDPVILWERDGALSDAFERSEACYPMPDYEWIEDRFWIWVHYVATKIERGELFEVFNSLTYFRFKVLGPLYLEKAGERPDGVRRIETRAPDFSQALADTVATHDRASCLRALRACANLYRELRSDRYEGGSSAETEVLRYLKDTERAWIQGSS